MWIERALAGIAPGWALSRMRARLAFDALQASYDGARVTRRTRNWQTNFSDAQTEVAGGLKVLRNRSRDLTRNNAWASSALDMLVAYQIGYGITPRSDMKAGDNAAVDKLFGEWARRADAHGMLDFWGIQEQAARARAESGEVLIQMMRLSPAEARRRGMKVPLVLQVLEADLLDEAFNSDTLSNGNIIRSGIEFDAQARPVAYHLFERHPGALSGMGQTVFDRQPANSASFAFYAKRRRVPAENIIHLFRAQRPGQVRGVPVPSPVIGRLRDLDELEDAALQQAKIQACLAAFVTSAAPPAAGPLEGKDSAGDAIKSFSPGMVERLAPGEEVSFTQPSGAGSFDGLSRHQLHAIAAAYGLTYDLLTGDLSGANYSSLRAGRIAFKRRLEQDQWLMLIPGMCDRVWRAWVEAAVAAEVLPPDDSDYPVAWAPPPFEFIDPLKDALATKAMIRMGLKTWAQAVSEQGHDPDRQADQIAEANEMLDSRGIILDVDPRRANATGGAQDAAQNAAIEIAATGLA